jgi:2-oxoisovalerate dehydrogenase E1 component
MATTLTKNKADKEVTIKAFELMATAKAMTTLYEEKREITSKYVHATSRGHEAVQLACALQLKPTDFVFPYYRDDSILLGIGYTPFDLMLQLMAKRTDPFSGGRTYYCHPSSKRNDMPKIPHQSSATGMQTIPATGVAQGIKYLEEQGIKKYKGGEEPIVICSLGDGSMTEGEIAEALQMAVLHQYPIIYLVQDNEWDISASSAEIRAMDAPEYAKGFKGLNVVSIDGTDFDTCYDTFKTIIQKVRFFRKPWLVHAKVPLLNHHTSGVRMEWYRNDLEQQAKRDPYPKLRKSVSDYIEESDIEKIEASVKSKVLADYERALLEADPTPDDLHTHIFAPTPITEETGERCPENGEKVMMVDAALHAVDEILKKHEESLLYGQDVGGELGGVFREAALLAKKYGDKRVFNTPIMEAYIIGSTVGMSAAGCKPIVEVQFADYVWPGLNQMFTEMSRSCYLTNGKYPVQALVRIPIGAYGSGGPYHSSSVESVLLQIKGIKVVYPSNAADMKGLMKAAFYDPNPVIMLEHKGLYWSKVKGTEAAKTIEPDEDYILPLGKASIVQEASQTELNNGNTMCIITYGMGVHWALNASRNMKHSVEIVDLRTLNPLDTETVFEVVKRHGKCLVLTEETIHHSFAESLAGRISFECFRFLDAPIKIIGSQNTPAIPLNSILEAAMLPNAQMIEETIIQMLND